MSNVIVGQKEFSHNIEIPGLSNVAILDCQVRTLNLFTKALSKKKVAVFGDYDIFIFYSYMTKEDQPDYKLKTIKKEFCEIIPYKDTANNKDVEMITEFSSKPTCEFSIINSNTYKTFVKIKVYGEIKVNLNREKNIDKKLNSKEELLMDDQKLGKEQIINTQSDKEKNISEVLQFEEGENFSIQQLMELDFESLKIIREQ